MYIYHYQHHCCYYYYYYYHYKLLFILSLLRLSLLLSYSRIRSSTCRWHAGTCGAPRSGRQRTRILAASTGPPHLLDSLLALVNLKENAASRSLKETGASKFRWLGSAELGAETERLACAPLGGCFEWDPVLPVPASMALGQQAACEESADSTSGKLTVLESQRRWREKASMFMVLLALLAL